MDKEFRNPSPPPSDETLADGIAMKIDNSVFDQGWLFETLILALQVRAFARGFRDHVFMNCFVLMPSGSGETRVGLG